MLVCYVQITIDSTVVAIHFGAPALYAVFIVFAGALSQKNNMLGVGKWSKFMSWNERRGRR